METGEMHVCKLDPGGPVVGHAEPVKFQGVPSDPNRIPCELSTFGDVLI